MERVLSADERIRKAEEIYARRKLQAESRKSATVNVDDRNNNKLVKKLIIQFILCLIIYISFYAIKNIPNLVPQEVMYKISDILEYDINIQELYNNFKGYITDKEEKTQQTEENQTENQNNTLVEDTLSATDTVNTEITNGIGGSSEIPNEEAQNAETQTVEESSSISQMEIDAEYIKANYAIMKPLEGEITSRYGLRNPTVPTVPKYHTGIDIAEVTGTVILAAMEGDVELVSSEGDLRKSCKNNKW